jgi:RNA polymerase sigma-70 factor (ECF subfamily)
MRRTKTRLLAMLRRLGSLFRDEHLDIAVSCRSQEAKLLEAKLLGEQHHSKYNHHETQSSLDELALAEFESRVSLRSGLPSEGPRAHLPTETLRATGSKNRGRHQPEDNQQLAAMDEVGPTVSSELLSRVKSGDEDASDRLVELMFPLVAAIVRRHIPQSGDHEDVIQEIFVKMFLRMEQFRGLSPFEHWVSRMGVTTCYDWLRKRKARPLQVYSDLNEAEAEIVEQSLSGSLGSDSIVQRELLDGLLDRLISRLNPREQIVIRLIDLEEHSVKEVVELTGWTASKIKSAAMRARRKLAEHLKTLEGPSHP